MLGNTTLQNWYAQASSLQIKPKVIAEWNANASSQPYVYGHGDSSFTNITAMTKSDGTQNGLTVSDGTRGTGTKLFQITFPYANSLTSSATEYVMTHTVSSADISKAFKLSFFGQSVGGSVKVAVIATSKDASDNIIEQDVKNINLIESRQTSHIIETFSSSGVKAIKTIEYRIAVLNNEIDPSVIVKIDSPQVYEVKQSEMVYKDLFGVEEVFKSNRPGDVYINNSPINPIANGNVCPHYLAYKTSDIVEKSKNSRTYLADKNNIFKYYIYDASSSATIFSKYENSFLTNKIVIKVNSKKVIPTTLSISTFNASGVESSPTSISTPFDSNGLCVLYFNSGWTKTQQDPPLYEDNSISSSRYTEISGVKITLTTNTSNNEVHLVEISPRLELDLSSYVTEFSVNSELSNDNLPLPISISNANTATIQFENLPNQNTKQQPFDNYVGILKGMIGKNVTMRIFVKPFGQDSDKSEVQVATMKTESWISEGLETSSAVLYDKVKEISAVPVPSFYQKSANPMDIVSSILDLIGHTDYDYTEMESVKNKIKNVIPYFWTVDTKGTRALEAIQNVLLPYQVSMYVDAYGIIRFKHVSSILNGTASSTYAVTDVSQGSILPNILDFSINEENAPSKISVEYSNIGPKKLTSTYNNLTGVEREVVYNFPSEILGYVKLAKPLLKKDRTLTFLFDPIKSNIDSYTGYLLVGSEIVKFDGMEATIQVQNGTSVDVYKHIIRSEAELDDLKNQYVLKYGSSTSNVFANKSNTRTLLNLERGCFGTQIQDHTVLVNSSDFTSSINGQQINTVVPSDNSILMNNVGSDYFVTHKDICNKNHRIYSADFVFPNEIDFPKNGIFEFGLSLNTTETDKNTNKNATKVLLQISQTTSLNGILKYNVGLAVKQYTSSETLDFEKYYTIGSFNASGTEVQVQDVKGININRAGTNSLVVMFNSAQASSSSNIDQVSVVINGDVVTFADGTQVTVSNIPSTENFPVILKEITIPALKLKNPVTLESRKISAYTNGKATVYLNSLQAFEIRDDNRLTVLSSVVNGNLLGLSNKNELESVVRGYKVGEFAQSIGFAPDTVGREIRDFEIEYLAYPVLYSFIMREDYVKEKAVKIGNEDKYYTISIPGESITVSSINHTPTTARFAIINSYTGPVEINTKGVGGSAVMSMYGEALGVRSTSTVSEIINKDNSDAEVEFKSKWIQSESAALNTLSNIVRGAIMKSGRIECRLFGNPLIEIGDILSVTYSLKNFPSTNYAVVAINHTFNKGLETTLVLRRIKA